MSKATVWVARHTCPSQTCMVLSGVILTWKHKSVVAAYVQTDLGEALHLPLATPRRPRPARGVEESPEKPQYSNIVESHCVRSTAGW